MKTLIVYTHPRPTSFNHAIYQTAKAALEDAGHDVRVRDLYSLKFKVTSDDEDLTRLESENIPDDIRTEQEHIAWVDLLVFVHPVWWQDRPALLKGWLDRVFSDGFAYEIEESGPNGLLGGKKAVVFQTTDGLLEQDCATDGAKDVIGRSMRDGTLNFCAVEVLTYKTFYAVRTVPQEAREAMLEEVTNVIAGLQL
ncbi:MAG: NAD(P)H-dependent oxidoreductase [Pseudomonadota bacterium]|nr:NAD(P)H-dependent oxidoreductase [Pseudomonadota bacterium]